MTPKVTHHFDDMLTKITKKNIKGMTNASENVKTLYNQTKISNKTS